VLPYPNDEADEDEALLRSLVRSEEERRHLHPTAKADGSRWFRSPNVVPIEKYRKLKRQP
jgi:hypothetical protein